VCIFKFSLVTVVTVTYAAMSDKTPDFSEEKKVGLAQNEFDIMKIFYLPYKCYRLR